MLLLRLPGGSRRQTIGLYIVNCARLGLAASRKVQYRMDLWDRFRRSMFVDEALAEVKDDCGSQTVDLSR